MEGTLLDFELDGAMCKTRYRLKGSSVINPSSYFSFETICSKNNFNQF